jgi:hypothetical protein
MNSPEGRSPLLVTHTPEAAAHGEEKTKTTAHGQDALPHVSDALVIHGASDPAGARTSRLSTAITHVRACVSASKDVGGAEAGQ